jgi:Tfp pilus assembly protein PilF
MVMFWAAPIVSVKQLAATLLVVGTLVIGACSSPEERAKNHYERGTELLKTDDYAHAALEFKNAVQLKNSIVPAWLGLAQVAEHDEDWADL